LEVVVQDPVAVDEIERAQDLHRDLEERLRARVPRDARELFAAHELRREEVFARLGDAAEVERAREMRMLELGELRELVSKPRRQELVRGMREERLERHPKVAAMGVLDQQDLSHAALSEEIEHSVAVVDELRQILLLDHRDRPRATG